MKIKNKVLFISFIMITITVLSSISLIKFIEYNYEGVKYKKAHEYYQTVNDDELYAQYLVDNGFIVTKNEIDSYTDTESMVCHNDTQEIIVYGSEDVKYYATFNPNISRDIIYVIEIVTIVFLFIYLISILFFFFIQSKLIYTRLEVLKEAMDNNIPLEHPDPFNDEITALNITYLNLINQIKLNDQEKDNLILAISHELKNPVANISSAINMSKEGIPPYNDPKYLNNIVDEQLTTIDNNILQLVNFYKLSTNPTECINLFNTITNLTKEYKINSIIEGIQDLEREINADKFRLILSNILSNIVKHGDPNKTVRVTIASDRIIFENVVNQNDESHSTKVGNTINSLLANNMNLDVTYLQDDNIYITTIFFK